MRIDSTNRNRSQQSKRSNTAYRALSFLCLLSLPLVTPCVRAAQGTNAPITTDSLSLDSRVDKLFAAWDSHDSPGCALAVVRDGEVIYKRGYGMANLEYGIRNTPSTIFHVASISKQFTAFAIQLLAQEGKLSLADDVRKYLPELHDFGKTITIRHLIHHTSGLRDQWDLLRLAGWRPQLDDVITEQDILGLVWRQRDLNFAPGTEHLYCNTGYTLLGLIVKRVSGKSLVEFTHERILKLLGMKHSHFHDDHEMIVRNRAYSYNPRKTGGYQKAVLSFSNVGATSLFTTVDDLILWDRNFYDGRIGGQAVLAAMVKTGKLDNGKELDYASGLVIGEYRGLKTVEHEGEDAGYRADLLRFPEQKFSVIILANVGDFDQGGMARKVAEIYLEKQLKPKPSDLGSASVKEPIEVKVDTHLLDAYVGDYELHPGFFLQITKERDHLVFRATGKDRFTMFPYSDKDFFMKGPSARVTFLRSKEGGEVLAAVLHEDGQDMTAKRKIRPVLTPEQMQEYAGRYFSEELGVHYSAMVRDGGLVLRYPRGIIPLETTLTDAFAVPDRYRIQTIQFTRNREKAVTGFAISTGWIRNLRFVKTRIKP